jgi:hypothetical protein
MDATHLLRFLHFVGLALGVGSGFAQIAVGILIGRATGPDRAVLFRMRPALGQMGGIGLALLWITGLTLVFTRWGGFGSLPGVFHAKVTAVVLLTGMVGYSHRLLKQARLGDASAPRRLETAGKIMLLLSLTAVALAVYAFN